MKIPGSTLLLFSALNCFVGKAQNEPEKYVPVHNGISVEKFDDTNTDENKYNIDNKIFTLGKKISYSYYYEKTGKRYLIGKGAEIQKGNYKKFDWKFVLIDKQDNETVKNIVLQAVPGNPFKDDDPDYNQTAIRYEYITNEGKTFSREITGAIENKMNCWIHPPRNSFFMILETNPFPYIKAPYEVGNKWHWKLKIRDIWSDKRWLEWQGDIENNYEYEIIARKEIETKAGKLDCFVVKATAKSSIGSSELISYFNEKFGFVKLDYKNIDGSITVLELERIQ